MEAQEFGEMMEHVDEVNFAIDGLKTGSQVRIRRASLLSLLSICVTAQQRRLLRTHGMAKTIIDAIMGLSFDDSPSNLAAAALFYILTGDVSCSYCEIYLLFVLGMMICEPPSAVLTTKENIHNTIFNDILR